MTNDVINGGHNSSSAIFVLHDSSPGDVARAMIEGGKQRDPFYLFDMDEAHRRLMHFKKMMPRIQIFYAMKANDSETILKLVIALGLGFDCASPGEMHKVLQLNANPRSIIFAVPAKTPEQMTFAREAAVCHTTFDNLYELKKIKQFWPEARLLLRIKVDSDCIYKLGDKFGCDAETEARQLLDAAAALQLHVAGIAFHVGSACYSTDSHVVALKHAKALFDYEAAAGRRMYIVDIGGGFLSDHINRIDQVSKLINAALEEYFPDPDVQVIAEPGRYICDSSYNLYCSINNVRRVRRDNEMVNMIYLNDGLFGTLRYHEAWHTVDKFKIPANKMEDCVENNILWGPSGDSTDRVMQNCAVRLPECTPFDWLVFGSQGAYTFGFASNFSCLPKPLTRPVISEDLWNKIKDSKVFGDGDFLENPDLSTPLPSAMPKVPRRNLAKIIPQITLKL